ncbi:MULTISPECIES: TetR/AcrR family transcriptional regulator [Inquilinus]|uniref:AcrR family transcriptional regulator n=1 Tax=Inquilinus ginsengisoli TaxID=363840 RepID=A0ABU1JJU1_9PROT|nr:TetR/AcrR family transcriptional regulator [Inquilinus ginsengisoli]MDR6288877.1 AcrR family transcriptional regulator [Inquilinus ginsengisoli]
MPRTVTERADVLPALSEVFREHGFEGASLALIGQRTGLGKGSLYHFFPGGKEEMAAAVLAEIDGWFGQHVFRPLREDDPQRAMPEMIRSVGAYFRSGGRVCLVGVFALGDVRDRFSAAIRSYFAAWIEALAQALVRAGRDDAVARDRAEEAVAAIQGALVLARALDDADAFRRSLARIEARLLA